MTSIQIFTSCLALFSALLTIWISARSVRIQRAQIIVELLGKLISVVDPNKFGWEPLKNKKYVSDEHIMIETKLMLWLNPGKKVERNLISLILALRTHCDTIEKLNENRMLITENGRKVAIRGFSMMIWM